MTDQELMIKGCEFLGVSEEEFWELLKKAREKYPEFIPENKEQTTSRFEDLRGKVYNDLFVLYRGANRKNYIRWVSMCRCKKHGITLNTGGDLKRGRVKGCGCHTYKHGDCTIDGIARLYRIYHSMLDRCYNSKSEAYKYYGKRGIVVCEEWRSNYLAFRDWALSHGYNDNLTIDRIDVNGNYQPSNCRWANAKMQANNRRSNKRLTHNNETKTITQWGEELGLTYKAIAGRIKRNWNEGEIFNNDKNMITHLGKSGERGLYYVKSKTLPWRVYVRINHKQIHLGYYTTMEEAIMARDKAKNLIDKGVTDINVLRGA